MLRVLQSKERLPSLATSALAEYAPSACDMTIARLIFNDCSDTTIHARVGEVDAMSGPSDWLGGLNIDDFEGDTVGAKLVRAAASIKAVGLTVTTFTQYNTYETSPFY